ncbi:MAG: ATP-binding protein [Candidatus Binatia bacterium]
MPPTAPLGHTVPSSPDRPAALPSSYPAWAQELADFYFSGTTCLFILHGNVHDFIRCPASAAEKHDIYSTLAEFLANQVFGTFDIVLHYDLGRGLRPFAGTNPQRQQTMAQALTSRLGEPRAWPRDPDNVLLLLDRLIERNLLETESTQHKSVGLIFEYAQHLVPAGDLSLLGRGAGTNLVRFLGWAQNPYIKRVNTVFCLVADKLSEVNTRLVQNPHVATVEIPLPNHEERERFVLWRGQTHDLSRTGDFSATQVAEMANGLSLVNLNVFLSQATQTGRRVDSRHFRESKKTLIERQCLGLLEFIEPAHTLDLVVGQQAAKDRLREDAALIARGQLGVAPMGYLLCGPVGTGKSFLAECYAGSIGIPCVKLRNFRSKYVGETEGNLEHMLTVLRSLGPVVVIIDEADAALGNRQSDGDSGTSSRVFSMIASQMGDTRYRGKIVWMLLTSRPDLLPIDLKRQGRAEVHIPMFYPQDEIEIRAMFVTMARKNKIPLNPDAVPSMPTERRLSGADIESIVLSANRRLLAAGDVITQLEKAHLEEANNNFIPSAQGLEKELQELAAVLECTNVTFLPPDFRAQVTQPEGRTRIQERFVAIRQLLSEQ